VCQVVTGELHEVHAFVTCLKVNVHKHVSLKQYDDASFLSSIFKNRRASPLATMEWLIHHTLDVHPLNNIRLNPVPNAQVCVYLTVHITKLQLQTTFPKPLYI
jgi:mRNA degradation ribonuclease J1/J2